MTNPTRRTVVAAAAAATLAGCQTSATTPDGTKPIKKALREHYAGVEVTDAGYPTVSEVSTDD